MISYDSYKNRIEKVAKVKAFVVKYKFLIIGILAILIAGISALLATKGMITLATSLPAEIVYGDDYNPTEATAFLSDVKFEYSLQGRDEWSEEKPLKVGAYRVRTVTNQAFGKGYGDPINFTIVKRKATLTIKSDSMTYGNEPVCELDEIVKKYGDSITAVGAKYDLPKSGESMQVDVTVSKVIITDGNGNDSTDCYEYAPASKEITLEKRIINVIPLNIEEEYNGKTFEVNKVDFATTTLQTLQINSDKITYEINAVSPKNAGTYDIALSNVKIAHNGEDVTHLYSIVDSYTANFTVRRKPVTISTGSGSKVYDGTPLTNGELTYDGLIAGHTVSANSAFITPVNFGEYQNAVSGFTITSPEDGPVTDNYIITPVYGNLSISKRPITISSKGLTETYDGLPHTTTGYDETLTATATDKGLAPSHTLQILSSTPATDYKDGGYENKLTYNIYDANGSPAINNYAVTELYGKLVIEKRPITVLTGDDTFKYNGLAQSSAKGEVALGSLALVSHSIQVSNPFTVTDVKDTAPNNNKSEFKVYANGKDISINYSISYNYGTLTVTPRVITVTLSNYSAIYGESYSYKTGANNYAKISGDGLVSGEKLEVTNVTYGFGTVTRPAYSDIAYGVFSDSCNITKPNGTNGNGNYTVSYAQGYLTIDKRPVVVETVSKVKEEYDGQPLTNNQTKNYYLGNQNKAGLLDNDRLVIDTSTLPAITDAGTVSNTINFTLPNDNYYLADVIYGELTVKPKKISLTPHDLSTTYGEAVNYVLGANGGEILSPALVTGESLTSISVNYAPALKTIPDAGTYRITTAKNNITILKQDGSPSTGNYEVTFNSGTLRIAKKDIKFVSADKTWTYDGQEHKHLAISNEQEVQANLVASQQYTVTDGTAVKLYKQGGYPNAITVKITYYGEPVTENYNLDLTERGTLLIDKLKITASLEDYEETYGEKIIHNGNWAVASSSPNALAYGDICAPATVSGITYSYTKDVPDVATYTFTCDGKFINITCGGEDRSSNYEITVETSTLNIIKREITLTSNGNSWTYDGSDHSDKGFTESNETAKAIGQTVRVTDFTTVRYVTPANGAPNILEYEIYDKDNNKVTSNYNISPVYGRLIVTVRSVTITLSDLTVTYGEEVKFADGVKQYDAHNLATTDKISSLTVLFSASRWDDAYDGYEVYCNINDIIISNSENTVVTENYDIAVVIGNLTIEQRNLTLTSKDNEWTYDDTDHFEEGYDITSGTLAEGQTISVTDNTKVRDYKDGGYANDLTYTVYDSSNNDVTHNYAIKEVNGTLTVLRREITLTSHDQTWLYDGDFHQEKGFDEDGETARGIGHTVIVNTATEVRDYNGDGVPNVQTYRITANGGRVVTNNYTITPECGTLKITQRHVTVTLTVQPENITYGDEYGITATVAGDDGLADGEYFVPSSLIYYKGETRLTSAPADAGDYTVKADLKNCYFLYADDTVQDGYENYAFDCTDDDTLVAFTINKRKVYIDLLDTTVTYGDDDNEEGANYYYRVLKIRTECPDDTQIVVVFTQTDENGAEREVIPINVGSYTAKFDLESSVIDGNYELVPLTESATLTILTRTLEIRSKDITAVYGNKIEYPSDINNFVYGYSSNRTAYGDQIEIYIDLEAISKPAVGTYHLPVKGVKVADYNGLSSVSEEFISYQHSAKGDWYDFGNYTFVYDTSYKGLTVTPRPITVYLNDAENDGEVYGAKLSYTPHTVEAPDVDLAYGETLEVHAKFYADAQLRNTGNCVTVGTYYYTVDKSSSKIDGENSGLDNYEITCTPRTAEILKKNIKIKINDYLDENAFTYGGVSFSFPSDGFEYVDETSTAYGEELRILSYKEGFITQSGTVDYDWTYLVAGTYILIPNSYWLIRGSNPYAVFDNYDIKYDFGKVEVKPREITVNTVDQLDFIFGDSNIEYPAEFGNAVVGGMGLAGTDKLKITEVEYYTTDGEGNKLSKLDGAPTEAGVYIAVPCAVEVCKYNGVDVTDSYAVTYGEGAEFRITARYVKVQLDETPLIYDGTDQTQTKIIKAYFVDADGNFMRDLNREELNGIVPSPDVPAYKNVGKYDNDVKFAKENYVIETLPATLTIIPRPVTVKTKSKYDFIYNAGEHVFEELEITSDYDFVDGYSVVWSTKPVINVGDYSDNICTIVFDNDEDGLIAKNYDINYVTGVLTVQPRPLTVVTASDTKPYDGKPLTNNGFEQYYFQDEGKQGLLNGDELTIKGALPAIVDAGDIKNLITFNLPSDNYFIKEVKAGTLKVEKIKLQGVINPVTAIYGNTYSPTCEVTGLIDEEGYKETFIPVYTYGKVIDGNMYAIKGGAKYVDEYDIRFDLGNLGITYQNGRDGKGIDNYDLSELHTVTGTLTITHREITVTLNKYSVVYGDKYDYEAGNEEIGEMLLAERYGDRLTVKNVVYEGIEKAVPDVDDYAVSATIVILDADGNDVTSNYDILSVTDGLLTITQREITYKLNYFSVIYGEEIEYPYDGNKIINSPRKLVQGHELTITYVTFDLPKAIPDVGIYEVIGKSENVKITNGEEDVTENYKVTVESGVLTVQQRPVMIALLDFEKESYDYGEEVAYKNEFNNFTPVEAEGYYGIVDGESLKIAVTYSKDGEHGVVLKNAGLYDYALDALNSFVSGCVGKENGISNYDLHAESSKQILINKLYLEISLNARSNETYDGNEMTHNGGFSYNEEEYHFGYNETLKVAVDYYLLDENGNKLYKLENSAPRNAGRYAVEFNAQKSTAGGISSTVNYEIDADGVEFEIFKRQIEIVISSDLSKEYNGYPYHIDDATDEEFTVVNLASSDYVERTVIFKDKDGNTVTPKNAGEYTVEFVEEDLAIWSLDGDEVTQNYEVTKIETGALNISKRKYNVEVYGDDREAVPTPNDPLEIEDYRSDFVYDDRGRLTPFYSYFKQTDEGFEEVSPNSILMPGTYEVRLSFTENSYEASYGDFTARLATNEEILENYEEESNTPGTLIITQRKVIVKAKYDGVPEKEYDGYPIDESKLSYSHIHRDKEGNEDAGFTDGYELTLTASYEFYDNTGKLLDSAPKNAGSYFIKVVFTPEVPKSDYEVIQEDLLQFVITPRKITYDTSMNSLKNSTYENVSIYDKYPLDGLTYTTPKGILPDDASSNTLKLAYYNPSFGTDCKKDYAGSYRLRVELDKKDGNYVIDHANSQFAEFTIATRTLWVAPVGDHDIYKGQTLQVTGYNILKGELVQNNTLSIATSGTLSYPETYKAVTINRVTIVDEEGKDVTACYDILCTYKQDVVGEEFTRFDFVAELYFDAREVYYNQIVLTQREFNYSDYEGAEIPLNIPAGESLAEVVAGMGDGLYSGHEFYMEGRSSISEVGKYGKWVYVGVRDKVTKEDVTDLYKLKLNNKDQSALTVKGYPLSFDISTLTDEKLEKAWLENDTSILQPYNSYYKLLNSQIYADSVVGLTDETLTILVDRDIDTGKFYLTVSVKDSKGSDISHLYELDVKTSAELTAEIY